MNRKYFFMIAFTFCITTTTVVVCSLTIASPRTCPDTQLPCGTAFCYDPTTQYCTEAGFVVTCITACGKQCYNAANQICINGTICSIGEDVCEVKYDVSGNPVKPSQFQCFHSYYQRCLNHTICYEKDRICNGQCIPYSSRYDYERLVCANDNVTLCRVSNIYTNYKPNQIQLCNGTCYDTEMGMKHCVNGSVQCVSNCSNACYNASEYVCVNGVICLPQQNACLTNYSSYDGQPLWSPQLTCFDPRTHKCLDNALCLNDRICNGKCITGNNAPYQVCAADRRTICNVSGRFNSYRRYQMHLCNGECYDTSYQKCFNELLSCIDDSCNNKCYDSAYGVCVNGTLCSIGQDVCEVKYDVSGNPVKPSQFQCFHSYNQRCLNHTICYGKDRICNGQCIPYSSWYDYEHLVCANDNVTLCRVSNIYTNYKPNQIQVCNGTCFDAGIPPLRQCIDGRVQCISNCSNQCYYATSSVCINDTLCPIGSSLCSHHQYGSNCYDPQYYQCLNGTICHVGYDLCGQSYWGNCYNPQNYQCLNGTILCENNRVCGGKCITNSYQVCAHDGRTVCNVTKPYNQYSLNQIHLCSGKCYDSTIEQCSGDHVVICIHDPLTQMCIVHNLTSSTVTTPVVNSNISSTTSAISNHSSTTSTIEIVSSTTTVLTSTTSSKLTTSTIVSTLTSTTSSTTTSSLPESSSTNRITTTSTSTSTTVDTTTTSTTTSSSMIPQSSSTTLATLTSSSTTTRSLTTSILSSSTSSAISTLPTMTTTFPSENTCCAVQRCTTDADCCVPDVECQCYRHNTTSIYGSCLNSYIKPICANGCPENLCIFDIHCCKCQCATVTKTNIDGSIVTMKHCLPR